MKRLVTIVGRPNVGKSTFFNRLTESRDAIIDSVSGVTRDRKFGKVEWTNSWFNIVDTGGYVTNSDDVFEKEIINQAMISIEEAEMVIFMVDVNTGVTDLDQQMANMLRKVDKPVLLVCNKVDTAVHEANAYEFYSLGISDTIHSISANNGYGTGDLLDLIIETLGPEEEEEEEDLPRIAIVGKPNVGKSTFVNTILGEERNIVTNIAGTTRDAVDTRFNSFGFDFLITDTAGLRKTKKMEDNIEYYSSVRTFKAIEKSDVCILLINAEEGITKQDVAIFYDIMEAKKGVVIAINKWDLITKDNQSTNKVLKEVEERFAPMTDVDVIFTSNVTKQRILKTLETALKVYNSKVKKIPTSKLNDALLEIIERYPPPANKGKFIRIKYITQLPSKSPAFAFFCNLPQYIKDPYKRFLENKIRDIFDFTGVPIRLYFRKK